MGKKTNCLKNLMELGINVHEYQEVFKRDELVNYINLHPIMSIRFDDDAGTTDLPFFVVDENHPISILEISNLANAYNCSMLCSNGHQYDQDQICNFVGMVLRDGSFELEYSTKKIPLRQMYREATTVVTGSFGDYFQYHFMNKEKNILSKKQLEDILVYLFQMDCYQKRIEGTLYPYPVGVYQKTIVIWQVREEN